MLSLHQAQKVFAKSPPAIVAVVALVGLIWAGCASEAQRADRYFNQGAYLQAVAAYEAHLEDHPSPGDHDRVLFRLAMAYALAEEPFDNPELARSLLQELALRYPHSPHRAQAMLILRLDENARRERDASAEGEARAARLTHDTLRLIEELESLRGERELHEERLTVLENEKGRLRQQLQSLRRELEAKNREITQLERKLEELKRIDTQKVHG